MLTSKEQATEKSLAELNAHSAYAAEVLKALAHQTRLLILCHIGNGKKSVQELEQLLETSQSNVSQHLAKMRTMKILQREKIGNQVFYQVEDPEILDFIAQLQKTFCHN